MNTELKAEKQMNRRNFRSGALKKFLNEEKSLPRSENGDGNSQIVGASDSDSDGQIFIYIYVLSSLLIRQFTMHLNFMRI